MAVLKGPLFGQRASGLLAGGLAFRQTANGIVLARAAPLRKPTNISAYRNQQAIKGLTEIWHGAVAYYRDLWIPVAAALRIPPYTAFIRANLRWMWMGMGLSIKPGHEALLSPGAAILHSADQWGKNVKLTLSTTPGANKMALTWHRSTPISFTPNLGNLVAVANWWGGIVYQTMDYDVPPGLWYYRTIKHSVDGRTLVTTGAATITVT